jgi:hypothetical protein
MEVIIQNAMMADAAHETLSLVRFMDTEQVPVDELAFEITKFSENIKALFTDRRVFTVDGFTAFAVENIKKVRVVRLRSGEVKSIGGPYEPHPDVLERCLQRMNSWTRLALEVIRAECPAFEVFQAFSAMALSDVHQRPKQVAKFEPNDNDVRRLAKRVQALLWAMSKCHASMGSSGA